MKWVHNTIYGMRYVYTVTYGMNGRFGVAGMGWDWLVSLDGIPSM